MKADRRYSLGCRFELGLIAFCWRVRLRRLAGWLLLRRLDRMYGIPEIEATLDLT